VEQTVEEIAALVGGNLQGNGKQVVNGVASLRDAGPDDVSFLNNRRYLGDLEGTTAGVILVSDDLAERASAGGTRSIIICGDPSAALEQTSGALFPAPPKASSGAHANAVVDPLAIVADSATIGPNAVIEAGASIGEHTVVGPGCVVGVRAVIGDDCLLHANVTVAHHCRIGDRVILQSGSVIGADGYGYHQRDGKHYKIPQIGIVQLDDDVEIGAGATVDRARFGRTWIKRGTKIDNLVQVAHNCVLGEDCLVVALTGIAGSTRMGDSVILAGMVGVTGHCEIGDRVTVAGLSGVFSSVEGEGRVLMGTPAVDRMQYLRQAACVRKLPDAMNRLKELEAQVEELKGRLEGNP